MKLCFLIFLIFSFKTVCADQMSAWSFSNWKEYQPIKLPKGHKFLIHGEPSKMIGYDPATGQTKNFFKFQDYEGKIDIVSDGQGKFLEGPKQDEMVAQNEDGVNYFCFTRARATYPWDFMVFLFNYKGKYYYRLQEGGLFLSVYYGEAEINMIDDFSEPWKMKVPNKRLVIYHTGYQGDGADEALDDELHVIDMIQKDAVKNHIEIQEDPKGDKCVYTLVNGEKKKDLDGMTDVELWQECQKFFGIK